MKRIHREMWSYEILIEVTCQSNRTKNINKDFKYFYIHPTYSICVLVCVCRFFFKCKEKIIFFSNNGKKRFLPKRIHCAAIM